MKKKLSILLCVLLLAGLLAGCGGASPAPEDGRKQIVATIFPPYDWTREILGDRAGEVDLTLLMQSGVDLHSFQPSAADIVRISTCDLFIYVGGESDKWVDEVLSTAANPDMVVVDLLETLGEAAREEETVEGMEAEAEEEAGVDEHVWLSLKNAQIFCRAIADALETLDPAGRDVYEENTGAYIDRLAALDREFAETVEAAPRDTLLFADRFPFRYLTEDYGLRYYAAFSGCSAETEASFETVAFLAGKADELALNVILQTESSDGSLARTVRDATRGKDQEILTLDSMQSVSRSQAEEGLTYLSVMMRNLAVLRDALM